MDIDEDKNVNLFVLSKAVNVTVSHISYLKSIYASLFEMNESKDMTLFLFLNNTDIFKRLSSLLLNPLIDLQEKIDEIKKLPILTLGKHIRKELYNATKPDGFCGYRILIQTILKMKTNVENNNEALKTYCNQFKQLDVDLRKSNGRELFVKYLNAMKASLDPTASGNTIQQISKTILYLNNQVKFTNISLPNELWIAVDEVESIIRAQNLDINLFVTPSGVPSLNSEYTLKSNPQLPFPSWGFLYYTNAENINKELNSDFALNYFEMKKVINCNNNIHTDMYDYELGHYHPAGNFNQFDSLIDLDILYAKLIHRMFSMYKDDDGLINYDQEYTYAKILNCFREHMDVIASDEVSVPAFMDTLAEGDFDHQIYETFFKMESRLKEYKLKQEDAIRLNLQKRLQREQRMKEIEEENVRRMKEIEEENKRHKEQNMRLKEKLEKKL